MTLHVEPSQDQKDTMESFARMIEEIVRIVMEYENGFAGTQVIVKANEAAHWFNAMIINGAKKVAPQPEQLQNMNEYRIQTLN